MPVKPVWRSRPVCNCVVVGWCADGQDDGVELVESWASSILGHTEMHVAAKLLEEVVDKLRYVSIGEERVEVELGPFSVSFAAYNMSATATGSDRRKILKVEDFRG